LSVVWAAFALAIASTGRGDELPAPFAPFEYLIGGWKGAGIPQANRLKGWPEQHSWAWRFSNGTPVGLSVSLEGDKVLKKAELSFDATSQEYRLSGVAPDLKAVAYAGTFDASRKTLTLIRGMDPPDGKERITLWPNRERIRYTMAIERQEPGAPRFSKFIEIGLTKEGEAFAAGSGASDLPKCIVTGGAATLSVTYEGKSYPLCCSGCRDEFNDNPAKYVQKALLRAQAGATKGTVKPASTNVGKDDGGFDGLSDDSKPRSMETPKGSPKGSASRPESKPEPAASPGAASAPTAKPTADSSGRAASLLSQAKALEKAGKTQAALDYYRRLTKDFVASPQAKTAEERIKALSRP
jgi:YHS domain-containing protein